MASYPHKKHVETAGAGQKKKNVGTSRDIDIRLRI